MFPILLDCMAFDHLRMRAQVTVNTVKLVPNHKCMVTSDIGGRNNWIDNCQVGMGHIVQHSRSGFALRPRRERPCRRRAAECSQQFPPSDGDCHMPLPCEVRKGNDSTPLACSLHVQGGQDAGCCHPASGSKAERPSFPLCPRKRTYLPILDRIPPPALGERCHRLETPPLKVAAEKRCCRASGASPTIDPLFRESYPENLRASRQADMGGNR